MERETSGCTLADRERLIGAYLRESIAQDEADTFEAHCMTCDECAAEIERGVEIRAALTDQPVRPRSVAPVVTMTPRRRTDWRWLAAAAGVVFAVALWRLLPVSPAPATSDVPAATSAPAVAPTATSPSAPVASPVRATRPPSPMGGDDRTVRSTSTSALKPLASRDAKGGIRIEWARVDKAARYVVFIFATSGSQLLKLELTTPSFAIDEVAAAFPGHADERLIAQVDAVDELGVLVASSGQINIPARRKEIPR